MLRGILMIVAGSTLIGGAAADLTAGRVPTADVRITSSPNTAVRIIAPAPAEVRLLSKRGTMSGDTLVVRTPVRLTASLDAGDLRVESADGVTIEVEAILRDAAAMRLSGSGRTLILKAGGSEIQVPR